MRPSGVTCVASTISSPAPDRARLPRCCVCQSVIEPLTALYWHIGEVTIRFDNSSVPMENEVNSLLPIVTPHRAADGKGILELPIHAAAAAGPPAADTEPIPLLAVYHAFGQIGEFTYQNFPVPHDELNILPLSK